MVSKTKTRSNSSALVVVASSRIEFNLSNPIQKGHQILQSTTYRQGRFRDGFGRSDESGNCEDRKFHFRCCLKMKRDEKN